VTFDPLDILAFGAGILIAAFIDVRVLAPNPGFWVTTQKEEIRDGESYRESRRLSYVSPATLAGV
jgi:hypothetical protein